MNNTSKGETNDQSRKPILWDWRSGFGNRISWKIQDHSHGGERTILPEDTCQKVSQNKNHIGHKGS